MGKEVEHGAEQSSRTNPKGKPGRAAVNDKARTKSLGTQGNGKVST